MYNHLSLNMYFIKEYQTKKNVKRLKQIDILYDIQREQYKKNLTCDKKKKFTTQKYVSSLNLI